MQRNLIIGLLLTLATIAIYAQAIQFEFLRFDDNRYVTENPHVLAGLTPSGTRWALTRTHASNWIPVTLFSHMLDVELFGIDPSGHHLTSILIHLANSLLLFALLRRLTGNDWPSAFAAGVFAVHPLHVESVAWISERKDVLSTLFAFLCMWSYAAYTRSRTRSGYLGVAALLTLSLLSKPMMVTLPCVLLLLDYWPLGRMRIGPGDPGDPRKTSFLSLLVEKIPLFALAALTSYLTVRAQRVAGSMNYLDGVAFDLRVQNAFVSYVRYLRKMFWPNDLSVAYPHPNGPGGVPWSGVEVAAAAALLSLITLFVLWQRNRAYLPVGWFWFVGTLVPVIGLLQVGTQSMADRYTYFPIVGISIMLAWGATDFIQTRVERRPDHGTWLIRTCALSTVAILVALSVIAQDQTRHWRNSLALFRRATELHPSDPFALMHYGNSLQRSQQYEEAVIAFRRSLLHAPENFKVHNGMGRSLHAQGKIDEAIVHYRAALEIEPDYSNALGNLGIALSAKEERGEAHEMFRRALENDPGSASSHTNYASSLVRLGRSDDAIEHFNAALAIAPDSAFIHNQLGLAELSRGDSAAAVKHFERAVAIEPQFPEARANLRRARSDLRDSDGAQ